MSNEKNSRFFVEDDFVEIMKTGEKPVKEPPQPPPEKAEKPSHV